MPAWTAFPFDNHGYVHDPESLQRLWPRLHAGDAEPLPADAAVLAAWALFHAGDFERAVAAGLQAGGHGVSVANRAQAVYATYLEPSEPARLALLLEVAARAEAQTASQPECPNAHYALAHALARYSQGIRIDEALTRGLGSRIKGALEATIRLAPRHADAHVALGAFHAEVIDKLGSLLGRTQGASKDAGLAMFRTALKINPDSAIAMTQYAHGLVRLEGERTLKEATLLFERAAACEPLDATQRLDVEAAKAELAD